MKARIYIQPEIQEKEKAMLSHGWEFHLVEGVLFITADPPVQGQVALSATAASDLMEYLLQHRDEITEAAENDEEKKS